MKRVINTVLYTLSFLIVFAISSVIILNKPLPVGVEGVRAEALADSMMAAVNIPAWESLRYVRWTYRSERHYVWDKFYDIAEIRFGGTRVLLNLNTLQGRAWHYENQLADDDKREVLQEAWEYWCNDSFWLNPIAKLRDDGTVRRIVPLEDGKDGLLVTYTKGGITPGDSYLWILNENGIPAECRMWVSSLPIKGLGFSWEGWTEVEGAKVATKHELGPITIQVDQLYTGRHHTDVGLGYDPFTDF